MRPWTADADFALDDATFIASRAAMAAAAARHRLPLICGVREMAEAGCLFSYSASIKDMWYRSASFVDKILKGAKQPTCRCSRGQSRSEEHTSELQSHLNLVCRLLLEKKKKNHAMSFTCTSNPHAPP